MLTECSQGTLIRYTLSVLGDNSPVFAATPFRACNMLLYGSNDLKTVVILALIKVIGDDARRINFLLVWLLLLVLGDGLIPVAALGHCSVYTKRGDSAWTAAQFVPAFQVILKKKLMQQMYLERNIFPCALVDHTQLIHNLTFHVSTPPNHLLTSTNNHKIASHAKHSINITIRLAIFIPPVSPIPFPSIFASARSVPGLATFSSKHQPKDLWDPIASRTIRTENYRTTTCSPNQLRHHIQYCITQHWSPPTLCHEYASLSSTSYSCYSGTRQSYSKPTSSFFTNLIF